MYLRIFLSIILFFSISNSFGSFNSPTNQKSADLVIFSFDRPLQLYSLLSSLKTYVNNLEAPYVLYRASSQEYQKAYDQVKELFPHAIFVAQSNEPKKDFKELFLWCMKDAKTPYILFAPDDLIVKDYVDMNQCINTLEKYDAFGFYLRLGTHITRSYTQSIDITMPLNTEVEPGVFSFSFEGKSYWGYPNTLDFALFKKEKIMTELMQIDYTSPNKLEAQWARIAQKKNKGLCYKTSKALNMPLNLVQQDWINNHEQIFSAQMLLDLWNQGLTINLQTYHKIENNSCHMPYVPTFIKRPSLDIPEKKITIIIPSYNNALYFQENLKSVLNQNYNNFHIIYVDDASPDLTGNLVEEFIKANKLENKITLIKNTYNRKALANIYKAIHMCNPEDIIMELDGDDALSNPNILKETNALFSTYDIWFAYAQYRNLPEDKAIAYKLPLFGIARPVPQKQIDERKYRGTWLWSGLRIFYAWLAQQIKLEDLLLPNDPYKGKFFPTSKDAAIVYPILEMAGDKFMFVPDVWLSRNVDTPINDFKIANKLQKHCGDALKAIIPYKLIDKQQALLSHNPHLVDILIKATDPDTISSLIEEIKTYVKGDKNISILFNDQQVALFRPIAKRYPETKWLPYNESSIFKVIQPFFQKKFLLLLNDSMRISSTIEINDCINSLIKTHAQMFVYDVDLSSFGTQDPQHLPCEQISNDIYAWKFGSTTSIPEIGKAMLIRGEDLKPNAQSIPNFHENFPAAILEQLSLKGKIGLFFQTSLMNFIGR
jgi:glycosyltransferase involved in cell wall biosynthesis